MPSFPNFLCIFVALNTLKTLQTHESNLLNREDYGVRPCGSRPFRLQPHHDVLRRSAYLSARQQRLVLVAMALRGRCPCRHGAYRGQQQLFCRGSQLVPRHRQKRKESGTRALDDGISGSLRPLRQWPSGGQRGVEARLHTSRENQAHLHLRHHRRHAAEGW